MKSALLSLTLLATLATATHAGLDLGWDDCASDLGISSRSLPCTGAAGADLYGNFQLHNAVAEFIALDFSIDIQTRTSPSGDFWNFAAGECNSGNLILDDARLGQCLTALSTPCFSTGGQCQNGFAWGSGFTGPNGHRLVGSIFRDATQPVTLEAGQNYFAFKISFFTFGASESGGDCGGCSDPTGIIWNSAIAGGVSTYEPIEGPGLVNNCVVLNGAIASDCGCGPIGHSAQVCPIASKTWGQVKSLYR